MSRLTVSFLILWATAAPAVTVSTAHMDNARNNANTQEAILTPASITGGKFGKLGAFSVGGQVYAQPLYIPNVVVSGSARNLLIVATMNNTVYAFDADRPNSAALWSTNFGPPLTSTLNAPAVYNLPLGCLSTPVVDVASSKIYAVCATTAPSYVLRVLSLTTGSILDSTTISGEVAGTGDGDILNGPNLPFNPKFNYQRPPLTLSAGRVQIDFGGISDTHPYHGWRFTYDASTLARLGVACTTPNSHGGSIWMSGHGAAVDADGNSYVTTGDGIYDGATSFGDSVLKFDADLNLVDWFTPSNQAALDGADADVSSASPMLIPGTNLLVVAAKDFNVYILDRNCLGHLQGSSGCTLQTFKTDAASGFGGSTGSYGGMFMNNRLYLPTTGGYLYSFLFNGSTFNTTPTLTASTFPYPGASQITGTSNGAINGLVWAVTLAGSGGFSNLQAGTLRAFDATTLVEIYSSGASPQGELGLLSKFSSPTVANGKVYVATQSGSIAVYGLLPSAKIRGQVTVRGQVTAR